MKRTLLLLLLFFGVTQFAYAQQPVIRVGVFPSAAPISYVDNNGRYQGIAVKIWQEIADQLGLAYKYVPIRTTYDQSVIDLAAGKYDLIVGPLSVTHERLKLVDYSRPYFLNKIGLVVRDEKVNFFSTIRSIFGITLIILTSLFLIAFIVFSHIFWIYERGKCKQVSKNYSDGIREAMWTTITSFLRDVLYDPKTTGARVVLGFWLLLSVIFMAAISALVTATLTYSLTQQHTPFKKMSDLNNRVIAVEEGTIDAQTALRAGAKIHPEKTLYAALQSLSAGEVEGVVDDYFLAEGMIKKYPELKVHLSNLILSNDEYAFAMPDGSKLKKAIDLELTKLQDKGFTKAICRKYITGQIHSCEF